MDVLYHGLVGVAIAKGLDASSYLPVTVSALLPDLIGIIPFYYFKLSHALKKPEGKRIKTLYLELMSNTFTNAFDAAVYRTTHSLVTACLYSLILYTWFREIWLPGTLGYLSHILIDIPTHDGEFATRVLYPYSRVTFSGSNWGKSPVLFILFWAILGAGYLYVSG